MTPPCQPNNHGTRIKCAEEEIGKIRPAPCAIPITTGWLYPKNTSPIQPIAVSITNSIKSGAVPIEKQPGAVLMSALHIEDILPGYEQMTLQKKARLHQYQCAAACARATLRYSQAPTTLLKTCNEVKPDWGTAC